MNKQKNKYYEINVNLICLCWLHALLATVVLSGMSKKLYYSTDKSSFKQGAASNVLIHDLVPNARLYVYLFTVKMPKKHPGSWL